MIWIPRANTYTPVLSSPTGTQTGSTTASLTVTAVNTGNGTLYWICSTLSTAPSATQIKAGQGSNGSAANASGNQAVSSTGSQAPSAAGLAASTTYYAYFLQHATNAVDSAVVGSTSFTTASAGGQLTIVKAFDATTGSRGSPGSAFGGDAALANNFFNAVDEACGNFQGWFCSGAAKTIHIQIGYGTVNGLPVSGVGQSTYTLVACTWANFLTNLNARALTSNAMSAYNSLPGSDPTSGSGTQLTYGNAVILGQASDQTNQMHLGITDSVTYFWSQSSPNSNWDAVGVLMHEISEVMGRAGLGSNDATNTYALDWMSWASAGSRQLGHSGYFSVDSGTTGSANIWGGAGDARDWTGLSAPGGTDACNGGGSTGLQVFTTLDKNVMDSIGWEWTGT